MAVQTGGDVTDRHHAATPAASHSQVTVTANPVELRLNTARRYLTVTNTQLAQLPFQERNPFTAALLRPCRGECLPLRT